MGEQNIKITFSEDEKIKFYSSPSNQMLKNYLIH